ncbi:MAG: hypothetical protein KAX19_00685, partial [Candidatus Brocadiae bacterium]|nr:hypothetical protein [Candidatus Brocadiia bacterium]
CGPAIESLPMDDRSTMCNMAIELGRWKSLRTCG